jgi:hypothetical protein
MLPIPGVLACRDLSQQSTYSLKAVNRKGKLLKYNVNLIKQMGQGSYE